MRHHIGHPDYVYKPWSTERRQAARDAAAIRLYGGVTKARRARSRQLQALLVKRSKLTLELGKVRARIQQLQEQLS